MFGMFWLPHPPLWVPEPYFSMFDPDEIELPANVGKICGDHPPSNMLSFPGQLGAHVPMEQWHKAWAVYLGMVAFLDKCVGRVIDALKAADLYDNTLLVFTSDHGEMLGSHGMFQKMCLYEESVRVPMLIKPPHGGDANCAGRRLDVLSSHLDIAATLTDIAEAEPMPNAAGESLLPVLRGEDCAASSRPWVFSAFDGCMSRALPARMARSRTHKLIYNRDDHDELYDLQADPLETTNLAGQPESAAIEREARVALRNWMKQTGDDIALCPLPDEINTG